MSINQRVPWTRQPQYPVGVNRDNSITRGLNLLTIPGIAAREVLLGINPTASVFTKGVGSVRGSGAIGLSGDGSTNNLLYPKANYLYNGDHSVFTVCLPTSIAANQGLVSKNGTTIPINHGIEGTTGRVFAYYFTNGSNNWYWTTDTNVIAANTLSYIGLRAPSGLENAPRFFINGVFEAATSRGGIGSGHPADPTDADVAVGNYSAAGGKFTGNIYLVASWRRQLADAEFLSLYNNPWQLFAPLPRRIWAPSAGAAPTFNASWARGSTSIVGGGIHAA